MNIGKDVLMLPRSKRAESRNTFAIGIDIAVATDIIAVRTATAENDDVQLVRLELFTLRSVLHDRKPSSGRGGVLGEKHLLMLHQPIDILMRVDDFAACRLMLLDPRGKSGVFQVAHANHAVSDASRFAQFAKDNTVLTCAPRIGRSLTLCMGFDVSNSRGGQSVQLLTGNGVLDCCNGFQPCAVVDALLLPEAHAFTAFLEAITATRPLDRTVVRLPAAFTAGMPARLP